MRELVNDFHPTADRVEIDATRGWVAGAMVARRRRTRWKDTHASSKRWSAERYAKNAVLTVTAQ